MARVQVATDENGNPVYAGGGIGGGTTAGGGGGVNIPGFTAAGTAIPGFPRSGGVANTPAGATAGWEYFTRDGVQYAYNPTSGLYYKLNAATNAWEQITAPPATATPPPTVTPTPTVTQPGQTALWGAGLGQTEAAYDPFTAFLQMLGLGGKSYYTPQEQYEIGQYRPLENLYNLQGRMAGVEPAYAPGTTPGSENPFVDFLTKLSGQGQTASTQAVKVLTSILGWNPEQREQAEVTYNPSQGVTEEGNIGMATNNLDELQALIREALRGTLGRPGANWLASQLGGQQKQFWQQQALGGGSSFLDYLKQKYNLGSFI